MADYNEFKKASYSIDGSTSRIDVETHKNRLKNFILNHKTEVALGVTMTTSVLLFRSRAKARSAAKVVEYGNNLVQLDMDAFMRDNMDWSLKNKELYQAFLDEYHGIY